MENFNVEATGEFRPNVSVPPVNSLHVKHQKQMKKLNNSTKHVPMSKRKQQRQQQYQRTLYIQPPQRPASAFLKTCQELDAAALEAAAVAGTFKK